MTIEEIKKEFERHYPKAMRWLREGIGIELTDSEETKMAYARGIAEGLWLGFKKAVETYAKDKH